MLLKSAFLKLSIVVQLAAHEVERGKEMINEIQFTEVLPRSYYLIC